MVRKFKKAIVFDFDGTLSNFEHREHLRESDFEEYKRLCVDDTLIEPVADLIKKYKNEAYILILTARKVSALPETRAWLDKHRVFYDEIVCRDLGDDREDYVVKYDKCVQIMKDYDIYFAVDDRPSCVRVFRDLGILTFQCGDGY